MRTTEVIIELLIAGTLSVAGVLFVFLSLFPSQVERLLEIGKTYSGTSGPTQAAPVGSTPPQERKIVHEAQRMPKNP